MIGAIIGDIVGDVYEFHNIKTKDFNFFGKKNSFTDDTVMTVCVAKALMDWNRKGTLEDFKELLIDTMHGIGHKYPDCGYGGHFAMWILFNKREKPVKYIPPPLPATKVPLLLIYPIALLL